jgi:hypothetical protein
MGAVLTERLGALGDLGFTHDWDSVLYRLLAEGALVRFRWGESDKQIKVCVVTRRGGDARLGIVIGGRDPRVLLGVDNRGPMIQREFVAGTNRLSNGTFHLLEELDPTHAQLWTFVENTAWEATGTGLVTLNSDRTPTRDDPLAAVEQPRALAGQTWEATAGVGWLFPEASPAGKLRLRLTTFGHYDTPDLAPDPAVVIDIIEKPQLFAGWDFPSSAGWTLGATHTIAGGALIAAENPKPVLNSDTGFETGTGWTDSIGPPTRPMSDDIDLVNDPANAKTGSWVMTVGPITQHQLLTNADMGAGLANWFASSTDATPHAVWIVDVGGGNNGTDGLRTTGWSTAGRPGPELIKYLRADSVAGGGVDTYAVAPGEQYRVRGWLRGHPGTDGSAYISIMIPHPTVPDHDEWEHSKELFAPPNDVNEWVAVNIENVDIPGNRFVINVLAQVHNHSLGHWSLDTLEVIRTRGNRAEISKDATFPVSAANSYEIAVQMRSGGEMQVGSVRPGVILTGPGLDPYRVDVDKGSTDYEWTDVRVPFKPRAGYITGQLFVAGLDIIGEPAYIDDMTVTQVDNNSDISTYTTVPVVQDQRYLFSTDVEVVGATRGTLTVGITLSGPAVADKDVPLTAGVTDGAGVKNFSTEVRPDPGYDEATLYVRSTDIEGGVIKVHRVTLTKMDNNSVVIPVDTLDVTPERPLRWSKSVSAGAALQRGTVKLVAKCVCPGRPDVTFPSTALEPPKDGSQEELTFEFTPPSGYNQVIRTIVGTDIEGMAITLGVGSIVDTDNGTKVFDTIADESGELVVQAVIPEGTEKVGVSLVAEAGAFSWVAGDLVLHRIGEDILPVAQVVDALLHDPITGQYRLHPGNISGADHLLHDWTIPRQSARTALGHLSTSGLVSPLREDRVRLDADGVLRYDWGTAEELYVERRALVLTGTRAIVRGGIGVERNNEQRADRVEVIGATLADARGRPVQIIGVAENAYTGNPDTLVIEDSSADHVAYANSLARYHLDRVSTTIVNAGGTLVNWRSIDTFDVGDWVYPENRDAGVEGDDAFDLAGETTFPERMRVVAGTLRMGRGDWSAEVFDPTSGQWVRLPAIRWESGTSCDVEMGTPLPSFLADPQQGAAVVQFNRFRLTAGR